ncbi:hypothetical protein VNO80_01495 [Phaseolus coccineus]|uniref:Disease resistance protein Roq1-like winged-helix domain-containing protein n=1 Tax=Phaseolus coccineus TaxID=3886 RepID=A0AAN9RSX1_PHACN
MATPWPISDNTGSGQTLDFVVKNPINIAEITNVIEFHVKHCRKALFEAAGITGAVDNSTGAIFVAIFGSRSVKMLKAYNRIESLVKHWRIALCEAVAFSRLVVQHYRGIKDNEINNLVKHAGDALCEAAGISGVVILNSGNESEAVKNIVKNVTRSRIIITTRDIHLLRGKRVDQVFTMKGMDVDESIELFSWHAFKQASPKEDFIELSRNVVAYSGGLPLALEVLGSYLFDMEVTEWKIVLEKLRKIPNDEVQEKLKISYDGLSDDTEKGIFLDIACFFIGKDRNDVIHILNGCGLFPENGIRVLVERSLVTVDDKNQLGMHDLLRDMGREIIRSKSPMELEERSRLWFHDDVLDVLSKETGTKFIEGLTLKFPISNTKSLSTKAFMNMKKLRLLQLSGVELVGDFEYLSKDLRWLCWHGFPLAFIPTSFYQGNIVSIELENSKITMMWKEAQVCGTVERRNSRCSPLTLLASRTHTPDWKTLRVILLVVVTFPHVPHQAQTINSPSPTASPSSLHLAKDLTASAASHNRSLASM